MKSFFNAIYLLFCLVLLVSCNSRKPLEPQQITETKTVKEVIRDTLIQIQADSTYYDAWIECVNGKPVLREPSPPDKQKAATTPGTHKNNPKALQNPKVTLDEKGNLKVECYKEVERISAQLKNYYEEKLRETRTSVYIEKPFAWYHKALMWLGGVFLLTIALAIIIKIKK